MAQLSSLGLANVTLFGGGTGTAVGGTVLGCTAVGGTGAAYGGGL